MAGRSGVPDDLHNENVLIDKKLVPKICDFGKANHVSIPLSTKQTEPSTKVVSPTLIKTHPLNNIRYW